MPANGVSDTDSLAFICGARASAPMSYVKTSSFGVFAVARSRLRAQPNIAVTAKRECMTYEAWTVDSGASLIALRSVPVGIRAPDDVNTSKVFRADGAV